MKTKELKECKCCPHHKIEGRKSHICGSCFDCRTKKDETYSFHCNKSEKPNSSSMTTCKTNSSKKTKSEPIKKEQLTDEQLKKKIEEIVHLPIFVKANNLNEAEEIEDKVLSQLCALFKREMEEIIGKDEIIDYRDGSPEENKPDRRIEILYRNEFRAELRAKLKL